MPRTDPGCCHGVSAGRAEAFRRGTGIRESSFPIVGQPGSPGKMQPRKCTAVRDGVASTEWKFMPACELKMRMCLGLKLEKCLPKEQAVKSFHEKSLYAVSNFKHLWQSTASTYNLLHQMAWECVIWLMTKPDGVSSILLQQFHCSLSSFIKKLWFW